MPLRIFRRGPIWHYRGTIKGRRLRGSCETSDKATASQIAASIEAKFWKRRLDGPEATLTFAEASILYRKAGKFNQYLEHVENYWGNKLVRNITAADVSHAAMVLRPTGGAAYRNRSVIVPTSAVINYAAKNGRCARLKTEHFPEETKIKTPVTVEWIEAFRAVAEPNLGALALFMFATGARISEALAVTWADLNLTKRTVKIKQTKIGKERIAHLPAGLVVALANLSRDQKPFPWDYANQARWAWESAAERAGVEPLSFHCCRHGFATSLLRAGVDVLTVARLGGWRTPALVLSTYGHAVEDITLTDRMFVTRNRHSEPDEADNSVIPLRKSE